METQHNRIPKGKCLCNRGCVRVGNKTEEEANQCQKECNCNNCSEDIRQLCFKQFIIDKDTSLYGFAYHNKKKSDNSNNEFQGKLLCNFGCRDGVCTEEEIQWCKDNIPCNKCSCKDMCIEWKKKGQQ